MAITFPNSPSVGQVASANGRTYIWTGYVWELASNVTSHAASHAAAGGDPLTLSASQISGLPTAGTGASNYCAGNDARLSDARTPLSHVHGNLTNAGAIGSTSGQVVVTTTGGALTTAATISASTQISGLAAVATSGSAASLGTGTLPDARLSANVPVLPSMLLKWSQPTNAVETLSREDVAGASITLTSGSVLFCFFTPLVTITVSQIAITSGTTTSSGLTLARFGIYTTDETTATLVARTASDTTLLNVASTTYTRSLDTTGGYPATYTLQAGTRYGVAVITVGTGAGSVIGKSGNATVWSLTPRISGQRTSQSDLFASGTIQTAGSLVFARLS